MCSLKANVTRSQKVISLFQIKKFTKVPHDLCIKMNSNTKIEEVSNSVNIESIHFNFQKIADLKPMWSYWLTDIVGIVYNIGDCYDVNTRFGGLK